MKSSYEKDLKSVNTRSNLYICILILIEPASSQEVLRGVLFIVRAGGDIYKAEFMHTKRTNCLTKMKIGINLVKLK